MKTNIATQIFDWGAKQGIGFSLEMFGNRHRNAVVIPTDAHPSDAVAALRMLADSIDRSAKRLTHHAAFMATLPKFKESIRNQTHQP